MLQDTAADREAIRSPREAIEAGKAKLLRRLRLAQEAARELEQLGARLDATNVTRAEPLASYAAEELERITVLVAAIERIHELPAVVTIKRARRARATTHTAWAA